MDAVSFWGGNLPPQIPAADSLPDQVIFPHVCGALSHPSC